MPRLPRLHATGACARSWTSRAHSLQAPKAISVSYPSPCLAQPFSLTSCHKSQSHAQGHATRILQGVGSTRTRYCSLTSAQGDRTQPAGSQPAVATHAHRARQTHSMTRKGRRGTLSTYGSPRAMRHRSSASCAVSPCCASASTADVCSGLPMARERCSAARAAASRVASTRVCTLRMGETNREAGLALCHKRKFAATKSWPKNLRLQQVAPPRLHVEGPRIA